MVNKLKRIIILQDIESVFIRVSWSSSVMKVVNDSKIMNNLEDINSVIIGLPFGPITKSGEYVRVP